MDWDSDGDEDFTDGLIEGVLWSGSGWAVLVILLICAVLYGVHTYENNQPHTTPTVDMGHREDAQ